MNLVSVVELNDVPELAIGDIVHIAPDFVDFVGGMFQHYPIDFENPFVVSGFSGPGSIMVYDPDSGYMFSVAVGYLAYQGETYE